MSSGERAYCLSATNRTASACRLRSSKPSLPYMVASASSCRQPQRLGIGWEGEQQQEMKI